MSQSVLSQASAFNPGADLWILPAAGQSHWTEKLDWYLNFQICKASRHIPPQVGEFIKDVLTETELPAIEIKAARQAPLMIASAELLPNKWVVVLPISDGFDSWVAEVARIWKQLGSPTFRAFLPPGQSAGRLLELWHKHHAFQQFTVVLD